MYIVRSFLPSSQSKAQRCHHRLLNEAAYRPFHAHDSLCFDLWRSDITRHQHHHSIQPVANVHCQANYASMLNRTDDTHYTTCRFALKSTNDHGTCIIVVTLHIPKDITGHNDKWHHLPHCNQTNVSTGSERFDKMSSHESAVTSHSQTTGVSPREPVKHWITGREVTKDTCMDKLLHLHITSNVTLGHRTTSQQVMTKQVKNDTQTRRPHNPMLSVATTAEKVAPYWMGSKRAHMVAGKVTNWRHYHICEHDHPERPRIRCTTTRVRTLLLLKRLRSHSWGFSVQLDIVCQNFHSSLWCDRGNRDRVNKDTVMGRYFSALAG